MPPDEQLPPTELEHAVRATTQQTPDLPLSQEAEQAAGDSLKNSAACIGTSTATTNTERATNRVSGTAPDTIDAPPDLGKGLSTAIAEAEQIVLYTVRHGIDVPTDILKTVVAARKKGLLDRWSEDDLVKFWQSAAAIAKLVQPVTIDSIKATGSAVATMVWGGFSALLLVFLVMTQIIWIYGTNATTNIDNINKTLEDTQTDLLANQGRTVGASAAAAQPGAAGREGGAQPQPANSAESVMQLANAIYRDQKIIEQKNRELTAAYQILESWVSPFVSVSELPAPPAPLPVRRQNLTPQGILVEETAAEAATRAAAAAEETRLAVWHQVLLDAAKARLKAMSGYVLPLLYGLLGAAAYVMRSLSKEISEVTFSKVSHVRFALRLVLGMLSGISVGLVLTPETFPTTLSAVTPLALAFLAGYSVELVFSAMDRLISAFSSEGPRSPAK